jgi:hypothetical protein
MSLKDVAREWIVGADLPAITPHVFDQSLHIAWGFAISYIASRCGMRGLWVHMLLPVLAVLPREFVDQWPINNPMDTVTDLMFFAIGGLIAWIVRKHHV